MLVKCIQTDDLTFRAYTILQAKSTETKVWIAAHCFNSVQINCVHNIYLPDKVVGEVILFTIETEKPTVLNKIHSIILAN